MIIQSTSTLSLSSGKTLLPVPAGAERVVDEGSNGHHENGNGNGHATTTVDSNLLHAIESVVIEWSHQVQDVLKKDSSQALLDGGSPLPGVEVEFWRSRYTNLLNIHEQVSEEKDFCSANTKPLPLQLLVERSSCEKDGGIAAQNQFQLLSCL